MKFHTIFADHVWKYEASVSTWRQFLFRFSSVSAVLGLGAHFPVSVLLLLKRRLTFAPALST